MEEDMDKALTELRLVEEDEVPFKMPNNPEFCSNEKNKLSLVGRVLNPRCQKMSSLILDMPRKWQKQGKVQGIALTKEKFQFVFENEYDFEEVFAKGVQTYNQWAIVMEKWIPNPDEDYLNYVTVWVQIRNFPMNYFTIPAITAIGEQIGEVVEVMYDPKKPMTKEFVRVKVRIHVSQPLRQSRRIELPHGEIIRVKCHYERIEKRCYACQRLTHERDECPLLASQKQQDYTKGSKPDNRSGKGSPDIIGKDDPLYGVLTESQVGKDKITGRRKIAEEILDQLRIMLLAAPEEKLKIEKEYVKRLVKEAEQNTLTQHAVLSLLPLLKVTIEHEKWKGIAQEGDPIRKEYQPPISPNQPKLMGDAMKGIRQQSEHKDISSNRKSTLLGIKSTDMKTPLMARSQPYLKTFKRIDRTLMKEAETVNAVERQTMRAIQPQFILDEVGSQVPVIDQQARLLKRKESIDGESTVLETKRMKNTVVPKEGSPEV